MRKYLMRLEDGTEYKVNHIGGNHNADGVTFGGVMSSYRQPFDNLDEVNMENGICDIRHCIIGDIKEAYTFLKKDIVATNPRDLYEYAECVQNAILNYFGNYSNISNRLSYFPTDDEIKDGKEMGKVSDLAHKNAAKCVERAMVAHNLLFEIGLDTTFKSSGVIVNGKEDAHSYNLIKYADKYYLFDATIPTLRNGKTSPIICEIPKEVYEKITSPYSNIGESILVTHYNPLQQEDYEIVYDAGRDELYEVKEHSKTR